MRLERSIPLYYDTQLYFCWHQLDGQAICVRCALAHRKAPERIHSMSSWNAVAVRWVRIYPCPRSYTVVCCMCGIGKVNNNSEGYEKRWDASILGLGPKF